MTTGNLDLDTFPKLLMHHSGERGERPAIREKSRGIWRTVTWRELAEEAAALAAAASARGLQRGAHVALLGDNRPRLYAAMCAAHVARRHSGAAISGCDGDEIASSIQSANVTHVFAENQEQVDKLLEILPRCPTIRCIVFDKDRGMRHYKQPELVSYDALLQQGRELAAEKQDFLQAEAARGSGEDSAFVFFTSGTTGPAKGVVFTHASLIDRARVAAATESLSDTDVAMAYLPPGWIGQIFSVTSCPWSSAIAFAVPNRPRPCSPTCGRWGRPISWRRRGCWRRCSPRSPCAWRIRVGSINACTGAGIAVAQRIDAWQDGVAGRPFGRGRVQPPDLRSAARRPWDEQCAGGFHRRRRCRSRSGAPFFRALGINLKQLYGSTETGFFVAMQRDGRSSRTRWGRRPTAWN